MFPAYRSSASGFFFGVGRRSGILAEHSLAQIFAQMPVGEALEFVVQSGAHAAKISTAIFTITSGDAFVLHGASSFSAHGVGQNRVSECCFSQHQRKKHMRFQRGSHFVFNADAGLRVADSGKLCSMPVRMSSCFQLLRIILQHCHNC